MNRKRREEEEKAKVQFNVLQNVNNSASHFFIIEEDLSLKYLKWVNGELIVNYFFWKMPITNKMKQFFVQNF